MCASATKSLVDELEKILEANLTVQHLLQPLMLIVPDIQDVYTPLQTDVIVPLSEVSHIISVPSMVIVNLSVLVRRYLNNYLFVIG